MLSPSQIKLHKKSQTLELVFDGQSYHLPSELLRVFSPSAEVRGHGKDQEILQTGKKFVAINNIEAIGNYAIKLTFDDGHNTGIYSWDYLLDLSQNQEVHWQHYLDLLEKAGAKRSPTEIGRWSS
ncbi:MAG: 1-(5-phosphoribosyl)-5-((5-phosphoribosylamino)methylideneamino)imidazole-4-carboxamide isomerase [Moraxellaceae bacterium]|nr:MAG: 1-(5-phosphoribosyl)-5-((5-phosphoribosylamino)methylideneamino)imidazole-4-carboxamide isomerase [Moraxellaceae bacterium]